MQKETYCNYNNMGRYTSRPESNINNKQNMYPATQNEQGRQELNNREGNVGNNIHIHIPIGQNIPKHDIRSQLSYPRMQMGMLSNGDPRISQKAIPKIIQTPDENLSRRLGWIAHLRKEIIGIKHLSQNISNNNSHSKFISIVPVLPASLARVSNLKLNLKNNPSK